MLGLRGNRSLVKIAAVLLVLSCMASAAMAQVGSSSSSGSGSAQAGTATSGPGRLVTPEDMRRNEEIYRESLKHRKLFEGEPSDPERQAEAKIMPGKDPRSFIAKYTSRFELPQGPPALSTGSLSFIEDEALQSVFPKTLFYIMRFRQWPLSANLPPPYAPTNIFTVDALGDVEMFTSTDHLTPFFQKNVHGIVSESSATPVVTAWLALARELVQDGMFRFDKPQIGKVPSSDLVVNGKMAIIPMGGNFGEVTATLTFANGDITQVESHSDIKTGMRPICQSTKLLDSDPIVRKMAEQDLLIMGSACKPYLDEQRPKLSPELQAAVDRIWQRILLEGR